MCVSQPHCTPQTVHSSRTDTLPTSSSTLQPQPQPSSHSGCPGSSRQEILDRCNPVLPGDHGGTGLAASQFPHGLWEKIGAAPSPLIPDQGFPEGPGL